MGVCRYCIVKADGSCQLFLVQFQGEEILYTNYNQFRDGLASVTKQLHVIRGVARPSHKLFTARDGLVIWAQLHGPRKRCTILSSLVIAH